jgi:hypothetical protein
VLTHNHTVERVHNPSHQLNLVDVATATVDHNQSISHSLTLTQSVIDLAAKIVTHTIGVSHSVGVSKELTQNVSHTLWTLTHTVDEPNKVSQTIGLTHEHTVEVFPLQELSDTLGLTHEATGVAIAGQPASALDLTHSAVATVLSIFNPVNTLSLTQSVVVDVDALEPFVHDLNLTHEATAVLLTQSVSHSLNLTQTLARNVDYNLSLCSTISLEQLGVKNVEATASSTLVLTHDVSTLDDLESDLNLTQVVGTNALLKQCGTIYYIPDKRLSSTLVLSHGVAVGLVLNQSLSHTLDLGSTVAYLGD